MRPILLFAITCSSAAAAQFPLPYWEAFDSTRVVLSQLPAAEAFPDTLWANGHIAVPIIAFDTVIVDQCCLDPDPPILIARLAHWPTDRYGDRLPLFAERLSSTNDQPLSIQKYWTRPDTMIPLTALPNTLTRYILHGDSLEVQGDHYGTWRWQRRHHLSRSLGWTAVRDSIRMVHYKPAPSYGPVEAALWMVFVKDRLVEVFQDNSGNTIDSWGYFDRAQRRSLVTGRSGDHTAIVLSSGEVLERTPERWRLIYREPSIYRGECDCE